MPFQLTSMLLAIALLALARPGIAQPPATYFDSLQTERSAYQTQLAQLPGLAEARLHFYPPDSSWRIRARFDPTAEPKPFRMPALSGPPEEYVQVGSVEFSREGQSVSLALYRNLDRLRLPGGREKLLLPFRDPTNGHTTYAAGRYLELREPDLDRGEVWLDFNRALFPLCAHGADLACPLPPRQNMVPFAVKAGEKAPPRE